MPAQERIDTGGVGEIPGRARPYRNGAPPAGFMGAVGVPWGSAADLATGGLLSLIPTPLGDDGLPACCVRCTWASVDYVSFPTVHASGFADGTYLLSELNGDWTVSTSGSGSCDWTYIAVVGGYSITLTLLSGVLNVSFAASGGGPLITIQYSGTPALPLDPSAPAVLAVVGAPDPTWGTWPATVSVSIVADCSPPAPASPLLTDGGDPLLTDGGDPLTT